MDAYILVGYSELALFIGKKQKANAKYKSKEGRFLSTSQDLPSTIHSLSLKTGFVCGYDYLVAPACSWINHILSKDRLKEQEVHRCMIWHGVDLF